MDPPPIPHRSSIPTPTSAFAPMRSSSATGSSSSWVPDTPESVHASPYQAIFDEFEAYPFSEDAGFKSGLPNVIAIIKGQKRSAAQIDEMIGRAQWYYFTRLKGFSIPWDTYSAYSQSQSSAPTPASISTSTSRSSASQAGTPPTSATRPPAKDPLAVLNGLAESRRMMVPDESTLSPQGQGGMSFGLLCNLISEGRAGEVPGVQTIPDQLNSAPPSQPAMSSKAKPWELPHALPIAYFPPPHSGPPPHMFVPRTSPPGTSSAFTDPPLAPSPSAFELTLPPLAPGPAGPAGSSHFGNDLNIQHLSLGYGSHVPSPVSPFTQSSSHYSSLSPQFPPGSGSASPHPLGEGVFAPAHNGSPSQSFANLSFAPSYYSPWDPPSHAAGTHDMASESDHIFFGQPGYSGQFVSQNPYQNPSGGQMFH